MRLPSLWAMPHNFRPHTHEEWDNMVIESTNFTQLKRSTLLLAVSGLKISPQYGGQASASGCFWWHTFFAVAVFAAAYRDGIDS